MTVARALLARVTVALVGGSTSCASFGAEAPTALAPDASAPDGVAPTPTADAGGPPGAAFSCASAPTGTLFCDDFESGALTPPWDKVNDLAGAVPVSTAGGLARAALGGTHACAYHWVEATRPVPSRDRFRFSFRMRVSSVVESGSPARVAYVRVAQGGEHVQHYLHVGGGRTGSYYFEGNSLKALPDVAQGQWVDAAITVDLAAHQLEAELDGTAVSHAIRPDITASTQVNFGLGLVCSDTGATVEYDDVLVTAP